jgi:predicted RNase H-like HicB family nuclease
MTYGRPLCGPLPSLWRYNRTKTVRYKVALHRSDEGVAISVPGLPGCWSQGETEEEALENIRDAIQAYLSVADEQLQGAEIREIEVAL